MEAMDKQLLDLLEERFKISKLIGVYKKERNLQVEDEDREDESLKRKAGLSNLPKDFIDSLFKLIVDESKKVQRNA